MLFSPLLRCSTGTAGAASEAPKARRLAPAPPTGGSGSLPHTTALEAELAATPASYLQPQAFFVSWQGVLTLAYSGFTAPLLDLKRRLVAAHPSLPSENPGSLWPKTSLGCLRDGRRLTPDQLALLCRICSEESAAFQQQLLEGAGSGTAAAPAAPAAAAGPPGAGAQPPRLLLDSACVALFECRSLERLVSCQHVRFQGSLDASSPSDEERARVAQILSEPLSPDYWFAASRDGNREAHYRGAHLGATLMHPLLPHAGGARSPGAAEAPSCKAAAAGLLQSSGDGAARLELLAAIERFRRRVEAELPGMYAFFKDASLHITLRAVIN